MNILFKAKTPFGEWVEGDLVHDGFDGSSRTIKVGIATFFHGKRCYPVEVLPETVCQYTGIEDKNGKKIFTGDKVDSFKKAYEDGVSHNVVELKMGCFRLISENKMDIPLYNYNPSELEVIGNIHDND